MNMIRDRARCEAFRDAIKRYARPGSKVVDLGCGSGILSLFAARAGAELVVAVDSSPVIDVARRIAQENGQSDRIQFVQHDFTEALAANVKYDVALLEQIGVFVWDENLLEKARIAKKVWLKPAGRLIPSSVELFLAPALIPESHQYYDLDFKALERTERGSNEKHQLRPENIQLIGDRYFAAKPKKIYSVRLGSNAEIPQVLSASFRSNSTGIINAFVGYMKIKLAPGIDLWTSPTEPHTHWGQFKLPLEEPLRIRRNIIIRLRLWPHLDPKQWRWQIDC